MSNPWQPENEEDTTETWRGDVHFDAWPEELAGPEYWLYKEDQKDEEEGA